MKQKRIVKVLTGKEWTYLKKGLLGWRVVYPIKTEAGKINWKHLIAGGSWYNLVLIGVLALLLTGATIEYVTNINFLQQQLSQCNINFVP